MVFAHITGIILWVCSLTYKQSGSHLSFQPLIVPDGFSKTFCLITGKCIHGIHDDDLHAHLTLKLIAIVAIVENRIQEALRLARTSTRCEQCRLRRMPILH